MSHHHPLAFPCPLPQQRLVRAIQETVKMFQRAYALQRRPVLKPQNPVLSIFNPIPIFHRLSELFIHKSLDLSLPYRQQVTIWLCNREGCFQPDDNVGNTGWYCVRPVVAEDLVVVRMAKGSGVLGLEVAGSGSRDAWILEAGLRPTRGRPVQTLLADKFGDAAVSVLDFVGPGKVAAQLGGIASEC